MIIKNNEIKAVERENMDIKIFNKKEDFENLSCAQIRINGEHGRTNSNINDRVYYVLSGKGWFEINLNKENVTKGDVIIVPKNTNYNFGGEIEVFLVHTPAFELEGEKK